MKTITLIITLFISSLSFAGGWTKYDSSHGDIVNIELIRAQGFMIHGNIGDAASGGSAYHTESEVKITAIDENKWPGNSADEVCEIYAVEFNC